MKIKITHLTLGLVLIFLLGIVGCKIYNISEETLEIIIYPNEVLREKALPVDEITPEIENLAQLMINTMQQRTSGVGLAAPQVGVSKRIIVVKLDRGSSEDEILVMVNPEIIERSENNVSATERCLSIPGKKNDVPRAKWVIVEYQNLAGEEVIVGEVNRNARIIQHEIDHLDGILIIDYQ